MTLNKNEFPSGTPAGFVDGVPPGNPPGITNGVPPGITNGVNGGAKLVSVAIGFCLCKALEYSIGTEERNSCDERMYCNMPASRLRFGAWASLTYVIQWITTQ